MLAMAFFLLREPRVGETVMNLKACCGIGILTLVSTLASAGAGADDELPHPPDTEPSPTKPLAPADAAAGFQAPAGFRVTVCAAEPGVRNPVAMAWDPRGRLWV